ncbi:hypothetical protein V8G54_034684 [Vigna mungo]|uniref:Uncharacterized protein n=1 Tax=Vigna mungo TaxID=3915 RepID=A0AAQ3REV7_VIGMU
MSFFGPFEVVEKIGTIAYKLRLPHTDLNEFQQAYPHFNLEDKVVAKGNGIEETCGRRTFKKGYVETLKITQEERFIKGFPTTGLEDVVRHSETMVWFVRIHIVGGTNERPTSEKEKEERDHWKSNMIVVSNGVTKTLFAGGGIIPRCKCDEFVVSKMVRTPQNADRQFWGCRHYKIAQFEPSLVAYLVNNKVGLQEGCTLTFSSGVMKKRLTKEMARLSNTYLTYVHSSNFTLKESPATVITRPLSPDCSAQKS